MFLENSLIMMPVNKFVDKIPSTGAELIKFYV